MTSGRYKLPVLLPFVLSFSVRAATPPPLPKLALARYTATLEQGNKRLDCRRVDVEIEASLPKLARRGRLQAIRIEGDRTVNQQVIARYLSAEAQAVAVSPANYKFYFVGAVGPAGSLAYVFRIAPRRKRSGLMQGELWIDAASGLAIRKAGQMVKMPSVFVRRIDVVQDTYILEAAPYLRVTHLEVDTRLAGLAELTIRERIGAPTEDPDDERTCSTTP